MPAVANMQNQRFTVPAAERDVAYAALKGPHFGICSVDDEVSEGAPGQSRGRGALLTSQDMSQQMSVA
jgi:hypothetical protein